MTLSKSSFCVEEQGLPNGHLVLTVTGGREIRTTDLATFAQGSHKPVNVESKAVSGAKEDSAQEVFSMDYSYNPGSPRPVPQAPRGRAPRIGVPPSPPTTDITPQVPPPPIIVTPSPPPPASESFPPPTPPSNQVPPSLQPPYVSPPSFIPPPLFGAPPLPPLSPFPFPLIPPPPIG
ncbi:hypothetical protein AXG93_3036s1080 [Marchantia polymorpha subsp. ruderalis]|uniref:Uncharacterized protein n=1 Tax=Marchantia polymorpha subsp. ruderalis TaxID=1480154 RepID=A0A176W8N7_MARPO|nr:hypothetical protein AXG93_3036s1080 [Marchantia polymorpha subsp. ruderalis]